MYKFISPDGIERTWPFDDIEPREVQLQALRKCYGLQGAAYFMRQRLGKTLTAFSEYTLLKKEGKCDWFFVICPQTLKEQWSVAVEQADFFTPICVYNSNNKKATEHFFNVNKTGGVFIINYESVKTFSELFDMYFIDKKRIYLCADESTKIKDYSSKSTKACVNFSQDCGFARVLTGRPRANSNADLWSQLKFIRCTSRNYYQHRSMFCVTGGFQGRQIMKDINVELLQKEIEPICYIAEDKYVKGFKKVYEPMRRVNLTGELAVKYKKMQEELLFELEGDISIKAPIILTKYLRLQQISSGIVGDMDGLQHNIVEPHSNPRIKETLDILENEVENKCIIVCRFRKSIENLYRILVGKGYKVSVLNGNMTPAQVEKQKYDFNEGENDILIGQTQVLNYGHTLCAGDERPCDSVIFFENDFSIINRIQCESRPEKYERDWPISYYDLYASKMDRYILEKLINKEDAGLTLMNYSRTNGFRPEGMNVDKEVDKEFSI